MICPNEACLEEIDCADPELDCGQYDGQQTLISCPACEARILVTTHIEYEGALVEGGVE